MQLQNNEIPFFVVYIILSLGIILFIISSIISLKKTIDYLENNRSDKKEDKDGNL